MAVSKPIARTCVSVVSFNRRTRKGSQNFFFLLPRRLRHPGCLSALSSVSPLLTRSRRGLGFYTGGSTCFGTRSCALAATSSEDQPDGGETPPCNSAAEIPEASAGGGAVEELISKPEDVRRLMKMERRSDFGDAGGGAWKSHWFPYLDEFKSGDVSLNSSQILEALDTFMRVERKERIRRVVENRSYGVSLVVEGLADFGNVSAAFRSADALGFQSVHVISCDSSKRCSKT